MAAGCLHHPLAQLVINVDSVDRAELQLAIETAPKEADLSEEEAAAFRKRSVAATRVVMSHAGTYALLQPDRPPRRCQTDASPAPANVSARAITVGLAVVAALFIWSVLAPSCSDQADGKSRHGYSSCWELYRSAGISFTEKDEHLAQQANRRCENRFLAHHRLSIAAR